MKVHLLMMGLTALTFSQAQQNGSPQSPAITTIITSPDGAESRQGGVAAPPKTLRPNTLRPNTPSSAAPSEASSPLVSVAPTAERPKRSGNILSLFTGGKSGGGFGGGFGSLGQISSSPLALSGGGGHDTGSSGGYSYGAPPAHGGGPTYSNYYATPAVNSLPTTYTQKSFSLLGFKRSLFGVLLQAVKAITGGAIALKGQLLKAKGQLVTAKGQIISASGDALSQFGRNVASNALMPKSKQAPAPAPSTSYGPPPPVYGVPSHAPPPNPPVSVSIVGHGPSPNYLPIPGPPAPTLVSHQGNNGFRSQVTHTYGPPQQTSPAHSYGPPQQSYGPPQQTSPPQSSYGPPQELYNGPPSDHSSTGYSQNYLSSPSQGSDFGGFGGPTGHSGGTTYVETRFEPVHDIEIGSGFAPPSNSYLPVKRNIQKGGAPVNSLNGLQSGILVAKAAQATPSIVKPTVTSSSTAAAANSAAQAQFGDRLFLSSLFGSKPKPLRPHPVTRALPPSVVAAASQQLAAQYALQQQQQQLHSHHRTRPIPDIMPSASMHRTAVAVSGPSGRFIVYGP